MTKEFLELLSKLSSAFGPSGCECRVLCIIGEELKSVCRCSTDRTGNLICHLPGKKGKMMIAANADETGFMITDITDKGYIKFEATGSADPSCFVGKEMYVGNETELLSGIGGGKVLHLLKGGERSDAPGFDKLFIDVGQTGEELKKVLEKGDFAAYKGELTQLSGGYVSGKALESRGGCALLVQALKDAANKSEKERPDIYAVFAVKEKAGLSGAVNAAYNLNPEKAILLGFAPSNDLDGVDKEKKAAILGKGPVLPPRDGRALFYDASYFEEVKAAAEQASLPYQLLDVPSTLSASRLHEERAGIPTVSLRIPCFNPETTGVILHEDDLENTLKLLNALM